MRHRFPLALLALVILFALLRLPFLGREYGPEEPLWVTAGEGVMRTGYPVAYIGETKANLPAYWKPPALPLLLGFSYKTFGAHEISSRLIPFLFSLGQFFMLILLARRIFGETRGNEIGLFSLFLLTVSSFAIQNATYVEVDGSILSFFLLLFLYVAWPIFVKPKNNPREWFFLFILSFMSFGIRFETSLLIFLALSLLILIRQGWRKALAVFIVFLFAILTFFLVYHLYNLKSHYPDATLKSLTMIAASLKIRSAPQETQAPLNIETYLPDLSLGPLKGIAAFLFPGAAFLGSLIMWLTIPLSFLIAFGVFFFFRKKLYRRNAYLFLMVPALTVFLPYAVTGTGANWPRHIFISFLLLLLLTANLLSKTLRKTGWNPTLIFVTFLVVVLLASLTPFSTLLFSERIRSSPLLVAVASGFVLIGSLLASLVIQNLGKVALPVLVLFLMFLGFSSLLFIHDLTAPYTLTAYYGNYGYKEAGEFLRDRMMPGENLLAVEVIGYYSERPYYDISDPSVTIDPDWVAVYAIPRGRFLKHIEDKSFVARFGTVEIYKD